MCCAGNAHFRRTLFTHKLGARFTYKLWLWVPTLLVLNNLPVTQIALSSTRIDHFVVGMKPELPVNNADVLFPIWLFGVIAMVAYLLVQHCVVWRSIKEKADRSQNAYFASKATTPMLFGFFAPKILLPYSFHTTFTEVQQALVLEHENVHKKGKDHWWNSAALCLATVFWFNPLVWLALRSFRVNQELACDFIVLQHKSKNEKVSYAKALVQCAEQCSNAIHLYPTFGEKNTMFKRLQSIQHNRPSSKLLGAVTLSVAAIVAANTAMANVPPPPLKATSTKVNEAMPIKRVDPIYPKQAVSDNLEGSVVLKFDIKENGTTDNIEVVSSSPDGVFDESALTALKQWHYKPAIKNGKAVIQQGLLVQLDFTLASESTMETAEISSM